MEGNLPAWIAEAWATWQREGRTGLFIVNWKRGVPTDVEERTSRFPPKDFARPGMPPCPGCGAAMEPKDRGTLFTCRCGRKMTLAQAARRPV